LIRPLRDPLLYAVPLLAIAYYVPILGWLSWLGDEGVLLHGAVRVLDGQTLYRDFFEILPPGAFLIPAAWLKVFGAGFVSARVFSSLVIATIVALLYTAARLSSGRRALAAMLALAWAVRVSIEANHHALTTAASMASAVSVLAALHGARHSRAALFSAGFFAGTALTITQSRGAVLCAALLTVLLSLPGSRRRLAPALAGMAVFPAAMMLHLAATGALTVAFDSVVRFPLRHYTAIQHVPFGSFATLADAAVVAFFPVSFALAAVGLALGGRPLWRAARFRVCLALAIVGLPGAYLRPDTPHLAYTIPLAAPLFALVVTDLLGRLRPRARMAVAVLLVGLAVAHVGYAVSLRARLLTGPVATVATPRGAIQRLPGAWTDEFAALMARIHRTGADDAFFFYAHVPMLPYLAARRHVAPLDVMVPGYTTPAQFRDTCVRVLREAQWVVLDLRGMNTATLRSLYPSLADPDPPERRAFESALALAFETVHPSVFFELRGRRQPAISTAPCDGIGATAR
jgi:hypothetical protein